MSEFEKIYKMCIGLIVKDMRESGKYGQGEEYVNEGYLKLVQSGKEINFNNLYQFSKTAMSAGEVFLIKKQGEFTTANEKVCCRCKQSHPIGFYGITKVNSRESGRRSLQPYCKDCAKNYFSTYYKDKREQHLKALADKFKKDREQLSDNYIKKLLRGKKIPTDKMTYYVIQAERKRIIAKRAIKKAEPIAGAAVMA